MKNTFRFLGIIVLVAVIGFSFVSCNIFEDLFGKEEEQETQTTNTQTPGGGQTPGGSHTHQYGAWSVTTAATCVATGVETRTCALDPSHTETRAIAIDPNAHDWNTSHTTINAATETTDGIEAITCKHNSLHTKENRTLYATGTTGLAFEPINNNTEYRARKGSVTTGGVHIPAYHRPNVDGQYLPVTQIGSSAFTDCSSLTSITIPAGVTDINWGAFNGCTGLTSITIPAGVKNIGDDAFSGCTGLTSITIPANVTYVRSNAFNGCTGLISITIQAGVKDIGDEAFNGCTGITSITIPASVTKIGSWAFRYWTSTQTINIQGHASQAAADAAWGSSSPRWRDNCSAVIKYWNGTTWV
jgi:hypothetical protein